MHKKNLLIYGTYLVVMALIAVAVKFLGLPTKIGLWAALGVAVGLAVFWPRW